MLVQLLTRLAEKTPPFVMKILFNIYPPYLGSGVKVEELSSDRRFMRVRLKLRFYNRNYVGTQFGGSIYSMTDPHYMYMLISALGKDYIVWDKAAHVEFIKPGRTDLIAEFKLEGSVIDTVREKTHTGEKYVFDLPVEIKDLNQVLVAKVIKTLYVRKKSKPQTS